MASPRVPETPSEWLGIGVEIRGKCRTCGNPVMVNAAVRNLLCPNCQAAIELPREDWMLVLGRIVRDAAHGCGATDESAPLGRLAEPRLLWEPQAPSCRKCSAPLDLSDAVRRVVEGGTACARCGERTSLRSLRPDVTGMPILAVGEDPDQLPSGLAGSPPPQAVAPIRFPCPNCSASLPVDGTQRTVTCEFCHTAAYLPDDLWRRFHPVKTVRRWYLWADVGPLRAGEAREAAARALRAEADREERYRQNEARATAKVREEETKYRMGLSWWRGASIFSAIGLLAGLTVSVLSLALRIVPDGDATKMIVILGYIIGLSAPLQLLTSGSDELGRRTRWYHYAIPAVVAVLSLVGLIVSAIYWLE